MILDLNVTLVSTELVILDILKEKYEMLGNIQKENLCMKKLFDTSILTGCIVNHKSLNTMVSKFRNIHISILIEINTRWII